MIDSVRKIAAQDPDALVQLSLRVPARLKLRLLERQENMSIIVSAWIEEKLGRAPEVVQPTGPPSQRKRVS